MKVLIKLLLNLFDYFTQEKINLIIKKHLNLDYPITVIDVGSHKGEYISTIKKRFKINKIYGFEPNHEIYQNLFDKYKKDKRIVLNNCGISSDTGEVFLNKNIESSSSSINELNTESKYFKKKFLLLNFFKLKKVTTKVKIDVIRLDNFIVKNIISDVDLLKIDTEGFEFNVLKSLGEKISIIKLIHFEHHYDDMIIKNYNFSDMHDYLVNSGFIKIFKIKMKFRKSFEYIYLNKN